MKKTLLTLFSLSTLVLAQGQTTILSEDFESGAGIFTLNTTAMGSTSNGSNDWVVNNSYTGGTGSITCLVVTQNYTIGNTASQPAGISNAGGNYAHILADEMVSDGMSNAGYRPADGYCIFDESHFMAMTNSVNVAAFTNVTLSFWWLGDGGAQNYGELYYSLDGGTSWILETTVSSYIGQTTWTQQTISNAAWDNQSNLRFGFRFVNGVPTTIVTAPSFSIDDFTLTGDAGACTDSYSNITTSACFSYTVPSGDETYTTPGTTTVMDTILNVSGCDSIMTISLTIDTVNNAVDYAADYISNASGILEAGATGATYQWIYLGTSDCNGVPTVVGGETSQTIHASDFYNEGFFAVIVTENGCTDTSDCIWHGYFSIPEESISSFRLFPNPSNGTFLMDLTPIKGKQFLTISDLKGSIVYEETISGGSIIQKDLTLEKGVYMIALTDVHGIVRQARLLIE